MSLSVCPVALVRSPAERVWALLADPAVYDTWWEATTDAIQPPGPAQPSQEIQAHGRVVGRDLRMRIRVDAVDAAQRRLQFSSFFPFGITLRNDVRVHSVDANTAQVSFG